MEINQHLIFVLLLAVVSHSVFAAGQQRSVSRPVLTASVFLNQVKKNHPILELAYIKQQTASAQRLEKQGAFDPVIKAGSGVKRFNSSAQLGKVQEVLESNLSMDFLSRYGLRVKAGVKQAAGNIKTPVSPTGEGGEYYINLTLPLFRGAGINRESANESKAFLYEGQTEHLFRQTELSLLYDALNFYWQWVGAGKKLEVEKTLLEMARFRSEAIRQKIHKGLLAKIVGIEAQREVQKRLGRMIKAERQLQQASLRLADFLWRDNLQPDHTPLPEQLPPALDIPEEYPLAVLAQAKQHSLNKRPELQVLDLAKAMAKIDQQYAQNILLPQIDLFVTPGYQLGYGAIDGGAEIMAGISMSLPVFQRKAQGKIDQAKLAIKNLSIQERRTIRSIMLEIENQFSAVNTTFERYQAAKQELDFAQQLEEGEKTRFEYGDSTLFLVNQRERSTAEAKLNLIDVLVEYHQSVTGFKAAAGEL